MTLREYIVAAIIADGRSKAKVARDADISYPSLLYFLTGANSRISIITAITDTLGYDIRLVKRE